MAAYNLALFAHILGTMALLGAALTECLMLLGVRRARSAQAVREWIGLRRLIVPAFPLSSVLIVVSGIYLMLAQWRWSDPWILIGLIGQVAIGVSGAAIQGPRLQAIQHAVQGAPDGPVPIEVAERIHDPVVWGEICTSTAGVLGIVFLMTFKPDLLGSLITMAVALAAGRAAGLWMGRAAAAAPRRPAPSSV